MKVPYRSIWHCVNSVDYRIQFVVYEVLHSFLHWLRQQWPTLEKIAKKKHPPHDENILANGFAVQNMVVLCQKQKTSRLLSLSSQDDVDARYPPSIRTQTDQRCKSYSSLEKSNLNQKEKSSSFQVEDDDQSDVSDLTEITVSMYSDDEMEDDPTTRGSSDDNFFLLHR